MGIKERLEADMKEALRARDRLRLETIRGARGAIRNKEIEVGGDLDEAGMLRMIRSLSKQRSEAIEQYRQGGRADLVEKETAEQAVLEAYLPTAPDPAEVESAVRAVIGELGAASPKDMGRVMKAALERLGPAADGKQVSEAARRLLQPAS